MNTEQLIMDNQNLIYSIIHKFFGNYPNKNDLFQTGCIGLIKASKNFDPSFNTKFSSYAYNFIYGEISKTVREDNSIKISPDLQKLSLKVMKAKIYLYQKYMREPTIKELSLFLEIEEDTLIQILQIPNNIQSLDEPVCDDGKEVSLYDYISDDKASLEDYVALKCELEKLSDDEKKLIEARFIKDMTQSEAANILGMSQVQVSRKEQKVLIKLKDRLRV